MVLSYVFQKPRPLSPTTKVPLRDTDGSSSGLDGMSRTQPVRPSTLLYRSNVTTTKASSSGVTRTTQAIAGPSNTGAISSIVEPLVAPKATPEDLTLTTFSSSSEEINLETMQAQMLKAQVEKKPEDQQAQATGPLQNPASQKDDLPQYLDSHEPSDILKFKGSRNVLLKHLSDSERFEDSASLISRSSHSGSHILPPDRDSGSGILSHTSISTIKKESEFFNSKTCLLPKSGSEPLTAVGLGHDLDSEVAAAAAAAKPCSPTLPNRLTLRKDCHMCGLSPSSPTYMERHKKFCHTGAHALDLFVSPDETSPTGPLWRPVVASTSRESPTRGCGGMGLHSPVFRFPKVGAGTPRVPMQTPIATMENYTDVEDDDDEDDEDDDEEEDYCHNKPLIPPGRKNHGSPSHISRPTSAAVTAQLKRTPSGKTKGERKIKSSREKYKKYSDNGVFTQVPDTSMRWV